MKELLNFFFIFFNFILLYIIIINILLLLYEVGQLVAWHYQKILMSYPKCRSVEVINNQVSHRNVNYINYK